LPGPLVGQVEPILVDQHGLVFHPQLPGFRANLVVDALAELTRVGCEIQAFAFLLEVNALNGAGHEYSLEMNRMAVR
jgi:hypothetical protein